MKKLIPLTALALALTGGVALADRDHGRGGHGNVVVREHGRGDVIVRENHGNWNHGNWNRGNWNRGNTVVVRDHGGWNHGGSRVIVRNDRGYYHRPRYERRPIYVSRPLIRQRYYNYYQRPALIVENYGPRAGYYWVPGAWTWYAGEWIWQPGHYQPDPNYIESDYDAGYYDTY